MYKLIEIFFSISTLIFFVALVLMFIYYTILTKETLKKTNTDQTKKELNTLIIIGSISFAISGISLGFVLYNLKENSWFLYLSWFFFLLGLLLFLIYSSFAYYKTNKDNKYNWKQIKSIDMNVLIGLTSACIISLFCLWFCYAFQYIMIDDKNLNDSQIIP